MRHGHQLRLSAAGQEGHPPIAGSPAGDPLTALLDDAGALEPGNGALAGGRRIAAAHLQEVGAVQAGGEDTDQHLVGRRARRREVDDLDPARQPG